MTLDNILDTIIIETNKYKYEGKHKIYKFDGYGKISYCIGK